MTETLDAKMQGYSVIRQTANRGVIVSPAGAQYRWDLDNSTCSCKAFEFKGRCKHLDYVRQLSNERVEAEMVGDFPEQPQERTKQMAETGLVKYNTDHGEVELSPETVRNYLVSGNGKVTDQEVTMFIRLCAAQGLNPWLREVYLIKYSDKEPASTVVGKEAYTQRAHSYPDCGGWEAGLVLTNKNGDLIERAGTIVLPGETLIGGWARVHRNGCIPTYESAMLSEYNTGYNLWKSKQATMIRKVALVKALREAFPEKLAGLYDAAEMKIDQELPAGSVIREASEVIEGEVVKESFITGEQAKAIHDLAKQVGLGKREAFYSWLNEVAGITDLRQAWQCNFEAYMTSLKNLTPAQLAKYTGEPPQETTESDYEDQFNETAVEPVDINRPTIDELRASINKEAVRLKITTPAAFGKWTAEHGFGDFMELDLGGLSSLLSLMEGASK